MENLTITKVDKDWVITLIVPSETPTFNPYDKDHKGTMDTICGVIDVFESEWGFAYLIDMDYAGKPPQWTSIFMNCSGFMNRKEFEQLCLDNKIIIIKSDYKFLT